MDELRSKTVTPSAGAITFAVGLNLAQIVNVSRQGEEKDYAGFVLISTLNGSNWTFIMPNRISFGTSYPIASGEKIHIIYKVSV